MTTKNLITFIITCLLCLQSSALLAETTSFRGKVLKFSGDVEVVSESGETRKIQSVDDKLNEMDTIVTKKDARIVVQFNDGAMSVLDEKSRLRVEKTSWFSYLGGKVYFTFKKVFGEPRRVRTKAATIGIRGTTFIIGENTDNTGESIALKEGLLQLESNGPAFAIHKQKELSEFDQFRQQQLQARQEMLSEFERYKQQTQNEFVEYRRQFTLRPNRVVNLSGYNVKETNFSDTDRADFESFEAEAADLIKAFHQTKQ